MRRRRAASCTVSGLCVALTCAVLAATVAPVAARAQGAPPISPDSVVRRAPSRAALARPRAPLSPKRAFFTSALLPGLAQSQLDRGSSGALFASVELAAFVMLRRSNANYREAKRFRTDTLPTDFTVGANGVLTPNGEDPGRFPPELIRTRRLHVEDWMAVIAFNHLFAGADAFVSAQLWDMPVQLSAAPSRGGTVLVATLRF